MADTAPVVSAWFGLEFEGLVVGAFRECTGIGSESEVVEYRESGTQGEFVVHKVPGRLKWNNITLKRGITTPSTCGSGASWSRTVRSIRRGRTARS